jgi:hypothetical protein
LGKPIILVVISALDKLPAPLRNLDAIVVNNNDINSDIKQKLIKKIKDSAGNVEYDTKSFPLTETSRMTLTQTLQDEVLSY